MKIDTSLTIPQPPEALSQAGLQFDVATEEDFDEIMAMSQNIYGGLDYLPTRYTSWLQETNRTVIVARKEGKVVRHGMYALRLIDYQIVDSINIYTKNISHYYFLQFHSAMQVRANTEILFDLLFKSYYRV